MSKKLFVALALCLSLLGITTPIPAQADQDVMMQLQREGWKIVSDGVLQRAQRAGEVETFVFGARGFTWKLRDLRNQLQKLQTELRYNPTPELRKAIASHRKEISSTLKMIERARAADANKIDLSKESCAINFSYDAAATARTDAQGTKANASASFGANCAGFTGEVYAYAFAKAWVNGAETTDTVTDGPRTGANVSATASASRGGGAPCESYSFASMTSNNLNPASYSKSSTNTSCPAPPAPLSVSVTSNYSSSFTLPYGSCVDITWTANVSGGTPSYTRSFYKNNVFKFSGTSYTERVCGRYTASTETITLRVDVTDSTGQAKSGTHITTIAHPGSGGGGGGGSCPTCPLEN